MKERPIIMSGPMVRAILEGRKTQTRRVAKFKDATFTGTAIWGYADIETCGKKWSLRCPYGIPADRLWVRETWQFDDDVRWYVYRADIESFADVAFGPPMWKPSIFMPRAAARILLEITDIRVEKLLDISEDDAICEGVEKGFGGNYVDYVSPETVNAQARNSYLSLWEKIHGIESHYDNPWVWVIEFKKIQP